MTEKPAKTALSVPTANRRTLLLGIGAAAGGTLAGSFARAQAADAANAGAQAADAPSPFVAASGHRPFYGPHQQGVTTPRPANGMVAAFNAVVRTPADLEALLRRLTERIVFLTQGGQPPALDPKLPPSDSGILGPVVAPDDLTVTVSLGASLFEERPWLKPHAPRQLQRMAQFPNDALDPALSHGDIALQFCANTQDTIIHALRDVVKTMSAFLVLRWLQDGNVPAVVRRNPDGTRQSARNFLGFRDGTANPDSTDAAAMDRIVWVGADSGEPDWAVGGSYQAVRIIRNFVERWDRTPLIEQQHIIGRDKASGAPLDGRREHDLPDYARDAPRHGDADDGAHPAGQSAPAGDRGEPDPAAAVQLFERRRPVRPDRPGPAVHRLPGGPREGLHHGSEPPQRRAAGGIHQARRRRLFLRPSGRPRVRRLSRRGPGRSRRDRSIVASLRQPQETFPMKLAPLFAAGTLMVLTAPASTFASTDATLDLVGPIANYKLYVAEHTAKLVEDTGKFVDAIKAGDIATAKALYAPTRMSYEKVEPIAELFSDLDVSIDARADDFEKGEKDPAFTGFHRLEYALWASDGSDGLEPYADKLLADVKDLDRRIADLTFPPETVVGGAAALMEEVAATKISGEEDRYSHTDLWDFKANFDGSRKIFELVKPLLTSDDAFVAKVTDNFQTVDETLAKYRTGDGYETYDKLTEADRTVLAAAVNTLAEDLSTLRGKLGLD